MSTEQASSIVEDWRKRIASGDVNLAALDEDLAGLTASIEADEQEMQKRRRALDGRKADREALQGLRNFFAHAEPAWNIPAPQSRPSGRSRRRDAILNALERPMHSTDIASILIDAGEIEANDASYHSLLVTLSQMYRDGLLDRPQRGVYQRAGTSGASPQLSTEDKDE